MPIELSKVIEQVGKDKGIDKKVLIEAIEMSMVSAAKKKYGMNRNIEAKFNTETNELDLYEFRTVVEKVEDLDNHITLEDAMKLNPDAQVEDSIGIKLDQSEFGRICAQAAKQVIIQKMREAEREIIYKDFKDKAGTIIMGIVRRFEAGDMIIDLGRAEAAMPKKEQIPKEVNRPGDRIRALVLEINRESPGPQIVLSRTHPQFVVKLFKSEVPEIQEGIVEIKAVAREAGGRTKIAVYSTDSDVDPVGACVGMKGMRVQGVVQELRGEKIDIVAWSNDPAKLICNALSPAEISEVIMDEQGKFMEVIVPDDQLSLAIGRRGQNVRLAVMLTGWKIDIKSLSRLREIAEQARKIFSLIPDIGDKTAEMLFNKGIQNIKDLAGAEIAAIAKVPGISEKMAEQIKAEAARLVAEGRDVIEQAPVAPAEAPPENQDAQAVEATKEQPSDKEAKG
jgi:N utilization substance protein A